MPSKLHFRKKRFPKDLECFFDFLDRSGILNAIFTVLKEFLLLWPENPMHYIHDFFGLPYSSPAVANPEEIELVRQEYIDMRKAIRREKKTIKRLRRRIAKLEAIPPRTKRNYP